MKLANLPEQALPNLNTALDQYMAGVGRIRMPSDDRRIEARGVLAEALLDLESVEDFLEARSDRLESFFDRYRVLLLKGDELQGSAVVAADGDDYRVETVEAGGIEGIAPALLQIEQREESTEHLEARLVQIPQIYVTALVLLGEDGVVEYRLLDQPFQGERIAPRGIADFGDLVRRLVGEHRNAFPPEDTLPPGPGLGSEG